ncbi:MAG: M20/M25/M40 family metallo-hydrolase [Planctomycetaceae bacterium]
MSIRGPSGAETPVAQFIVRELRKAGVVKSAIVFDDAHRKSPGGGDCGNLIVRLPGTRRGPRRLLMAHLDTVPLCVGARPVRRGNTVTSANPATALGGDDRSGAAVVLTAVVEVLRRRLPHPPLTLLWTVQEEVGLVGARFASLPRLGNPRLCFNWDGGAAGIACLGATGAYDLSIDVEGIASHAGVRPEGGVSALAIAGLAVARLQRDGWHGLITNGAAAGTSNLGIISGGDATNVVMPLVHLRGEVRSHDADFRKRLVAEFRRAFDEASRNVTNDQGRTGHVRMAAELRYESFRLHESEPCVQVALRAIRTAGLTPQTRVSNGGLDANWLTARGLPTVTLGSGQQDVHTVNESLNLDEYLAACRIALLLAAGQ